MNVVETYKCKGATLEIYREEGGDWRWRIVRRGRIIVSSSEGYVRRAGLVANLRSIASVVGEFPINKPT